MRLARLSVPCTGRLCSPGNIPGTHFCYRLSRPRVIARPKGLRHSKIQRHHRESNPRPSEFRFSIGTPDLPCAPADKNFAVGHHDRSIDQGSEIDISSTDIPVNKCIYIYIYILKLKVTVLSRHCQFSNQNVRTYCLTFRYEQVMQHSTNIPIFMLHC